MKNTSGLLTRSELAELTGITRSTIYNHANREEAPKPDDYIIARRGLYPLYSPDKAAAWHEYVETHVRQPARTKHNARCKCADCRAKRAAYARERRKPNTKRSERIVFKGMIIHPNAPHGTPSGYNYYGCLCDDCSAADLARRASKG